MKSTDIYTLSFLNAEGEPIVFYVGRTGDSVSRLKKHQYLASKEDDMTDKYRFIRQLEEEDIPWTLTVIAENIQDESESEFEYVLLFARHNVRHGISFFDGSPLTNLKNGDILMEVIDDLTVVTNSDIKKYRARKKLPISKLSIARKYQDTWSAKDQSSQVHLLLKELLRFFSLNERTLGKEIYRQTGRLATPIMMAQVILAVDIEEYGADRWSVQRLDQYLSLLEWADELGLI